MDRLNDTPDLPAQLTEKTARTLYDRESFRVGDKTFTRTEPGTYIDGGSVVVYCDQQDSTSWAARVGAMRTGYYWTPEAAVLAAFPERA